MNVSFLRRSGLQVHIWSRFAELFSTHPGFRRRIDAIARLGGVSPESI